MLLCSKEDVKEYRKIKELITPKDIVNYIVTSDIFNEGEVQLVNKVNESAFSNFLIKDYDAYKSQDNILHFFAHTKYDGDYAEDFASEVFRFIDVVVTNCNNGKGIENNKPLYVSISVFSYDNYDEKYLDIQTFSKCYNDSKVQFRSKVVGTTKSGVDNLDAVLKSMKTEGTVLQVEEGYYILKDFPYLKTTRIIDSNEVFLRKPLGFVVMSKKALKLLVSKPITEKRYFSLESIQDEIDAVISFKNNYLGWDSVKNCFVIITES